MTSSHCKLKTPTSSHRTSVPTSTSDATSTSVPTSSSDRAAVTTCSSKVSWESNLRSKLLEFSKSRDDDGDVIIWVNNTRQIRAHQIVLNMNCRIMKYGKPEFNNDLKVHEIHLSNEFDKVPDIVDSIIGSFYSGCLDINDSNREVVYTFALAYHVRWLAEKILFKKT